MQLLTTPDEMRTFDGLAVTRFGITGGILMENAGRGVADRIEAAVRSVNGKRVTIVCGKGNNGGDGFVIARHLLLRGALVDVLLLARASAVRGDAALHLKTLLALRKPAGKALRISAMPARFVQPSHAQPDIIVDAVFGTGFSGTPSGVAASAIRWMNGTHAFVVAVDIPSGVDGATGAVTGEAVRAQLTVTMAAAKVGLYVGAGPEHCGRVEVVDIGITPAFATPDGAGLFRCEDADIARLLPQRSRRAHKYNVGKVFVLAGSRQYTGAPAFTALAALRSGAGAVVLGVPSSVKPVIASRMREVIVQGFPETGEGTFSSEGVPAIMERIAWADVVVMGPGMGRNGETDSLILEVFRRCTKPLLVDADALTALAKIPAKSWRRKAPTILTPHTGELGRLLGCGADEIEARRIPAARESARALQSIMVLKGAPTVCALPAGKAVVNGTGNPGMATIGTGDVLSGAIAGLLALGMSPFDAAVAGVYLHGRAGDLAAQRYGQRSLLASDVLDALSHALLSVENS